MLNWDDLYFNPNALGPQPVNGLAPPQWPAAASAWAPQLEPANVPPPAAPPPASFSVPPAWAAPNSEPVLSPRAPLSPAPVADYDPFKAFSADIQAPKKPNLGVLGESFGVMTPADQQKWLEGQYADYASGQQTIKSLQSALSQSTSPFTTRALQRQLDSATSALPDLAKLDAMRAGTATLPTKTGVRAGAENVVQGFGSAVLGVPEFAGIVKGYLGDGKVDDDSLLKWAQNAKLSVNQMFPGDAARQNDFSMQLAQGLGQLGAFYGGGSIPALLKAGPKAIAAVVAALGAAGSGSQGFEEATRELEAAKAAAAKTGDTPTVNELDRILKTFGYAAVGTSEALPIASSFSRMIPGAATNFGRRVIAGTEQAIEEGLQEAGQQTAQNAITQQTTNPNQALLEGVPESAALGAILGGGAGFTMGGGHGAVAEQPGVKTYDPFVEPPEMKPGEPLSFIDLTPGEGYTEVNVPRLEGPQGALEGPAAPEGPSAPAGGPVTPEGPVSPAAPSEAPRLAPQAQDAVFEDVNAAMRPEVKQQVTNTPEFQNWFGHSAITDPDGTPKVVFHGTTASDIQKFNQSPIDIGIHFGTTDQANDRLRRKFNGDRNVLPVFLSIQNPLRLNDPGDWSFETIAPQLLQKGIATQGELDAIKKTPAAIRQLLQAKGYDGIAYDNEYEARRQLGPKEEIDLSIEENPHLNKGAGPDKAFIAKGPRGGVIGVGSTREGARANGLEYLRQNKLMPSGDSYIAFDPRQVKSVYNRGDFNAQNANISAAAKPSTEEKATLPEQPYKAAGKPAEPGNPLTRPIEISPKLNGKQVRQQAKLLLDAGRTVHFPNTLTEPAFRAMNAVGPLIPEGTMAGVLTRLEPAGFDQNGKPLVRAVFTTREGKEQALQPTQLKKLESLRAFYSQDVGPSGGLFLLRFDPAESGRDRIVGELWHETLHALRRQGNLPSGDFNRLLNHAVGLAVLDLDYRDFAEKVKDPYAANYEPGATVRDLYDELYEGLPDFNERMAQEAVAHMVELYSHGALSEAQAAPIRDILDNMAAGHYKAAPAGAGGEAAAARPPERPGLDLPPGVERVYHGTVRPDFERFSPKRSLHGGLAYFTDAPKLASEFAGGTQPTFLTEPPYSLPQGTAPRVIPADMNTTGFKRVDFGSWLFGRYEWTADDGHKLHKAIAQARAEGYKGLIAEGMTDQRIKGRQYITWTPDTVKHAYTQEPLYALFGKWGSKSKAEPEPEIKKQGTPGSIFAAADWINSQPGSSKQADFIFKDLMAAQHKKFKQTYPKVGWSGLAETPQFKHALYQAVMDFANHPENKGYHTKHTLDLLMGGASLIDLLGGTSLADLPGGQELSQKAQDLKAVLEDAPSGPKPAQDYTGHEIISLEGKDFTSAKYLNPAAIFDTIPSQAAVSIAQQLLQESIDETKTENIPFKNLFIIKLIGHGKSHLANNDNPKIGQQLLDVAQLLLPGSGKSTPVIKKTSAAQTQAAAPYNAVEPPLYQTPDDVLKAALATKNDQVISDVYIATANPKHPHAVNYIMMEDLAQTLAIKAIDLPDGVVKTELQKLVQGAFTSATKLEVAYKKAGGLDLGASATAQELGTAPSEPAYDAIVGVMNKFKGPAFATIKNIIADVGAKHDLHKPLTEALQHDLQQALESAVEANGGLNGSSVNHAVIDTLVAAHEAITDLPTAAPSPAQSSQAASPKTAQQALNTVLGDTALGPGYTPINEIFEKVAEKHDPLAPLTKAYQQDLLDALEDEDSKIAIANPKPDNNQVAYFDKLAAVHKAVSALSTAAPAAPKTYKSVFTALTKLNAAGTPNKIIQVLRDEIQFVYDNGDFAKKGPLLQVANTEPFKLALVKWLTEVVKTNHEQGFGGLAKALNQFANMIDPTEGTPEPYQTKGLPAIPAGLHFDDLIPTPKRDYTFSRNAGGGSKPKEIWTDKEGNEYLFKPNMKGGEFVAHGEVAGNHIARLVNPSAPRAWVETLNGRVGSMQEMIPNNGDINGIPISELNEFEIASLMKEHVVDWLISNHDAHAKQFLVPAGGARRGLIGIDKGQAFKYFGKDRLATDYHPNEKYGEQEPIYNHLWRDYAAGKLNKIVNKIVGPTNEKAQALHDQIKTLTTETEKTNDEANKAQGQINDFRSSVRGALTDAFNDETETGQDLSMSFGMGINEIEEEFLRGVRQQLKLAPNEYWAASSAAEDAKPDAFLATKTPESARHGTQDFGVKLSKVKLDPQKGLTLKDAEYLIGQSLFEGSQLLPALSYDMGRKNSTTLRELGYDHVTLPSGGIVSLVPAASRERWEPVNNALRLKVEAEVRSYLGGMLSTLKPLIKSEDGKKAIQKQVEAFNEPTFPLEWRDLNTGPIDSGTETSLGVIVKNLESAVSYNIEDYFRGVTDDASTDIDPNKLPLWEGIIKYSKSSWNSNLLSYIEDIRNKHPSPGEYTPQKLAELRKQGGINRTKLDSLNRNLVQLSMDKENGFFKPANEAIQILQQKLTDAAFLGVILPYAEKRFVGRPAARDAFLSYAQQRKENLANKFHRFFQELDQNLERRIQALVELGYDEPIRDSDKHLLKEFKLTEPELQAIRFYTGSGSSPVNGALREAKPIDDKLELSTSWLRNAHYANLLEGALNKLPPYKGMAYRGQNMEVKELERMQPGRIIDIRPFWSSSSLSHGAFSGKVFLIIDSKTGRYIERISSSPSEKEVLFPPDRRYLITGRQRIPHPKSGEMVEEIHLKELPEGTDFNDL